MKCIYINLMHCYPHQEAKIQPAEETEGDIVEDKDQFLSRREMAVKTEQRAEEKVGSGHESEVVNSDDTGNEEEEDEMEMGGMESEAVPAVASNHTDKCVIKGDISHSFPNGK